MNKHDFISEASGSFLTPKHDPNHLHLTFPGFRSVVTHQFSSSLKPMFEQGAFDLDVYINHETRYTGSYYCILKPHNGGNRVVGNAVRGNSINHSHTMDTIAAFSGSQQGWHCVAENSATIQSKIANGYLIFSGSL
ncbi:MAG: hypothetical protein KDC44_06385 [Phaeodactylibacter sp.]|nr:hypothetical protein [Phaeodactylibacter sp.]